jgi:hypothetical protein
MPNAGERRARLGDLLEERRLELARAGLHLTWHEVAAAAGISDEALRTVRRGQTGGVRPLTATGLERALRLQHGAVRRYLDGTSPGLDGSGQAVDGGYALDGLTADERRLAADFIETIRRSTASRDQDRERVPGA